MTEAKKEESGRYAVTDWQEEDVGGGSKLVVHKIKSLSDISFRIYFIGAHPSAEYTSSDPRFLDHFDDPTEVYERGYAEMLRDSGERERVPFENWLSEVAGSWHARNANKALQAAEDAMNNAGADIGKEEKQQLENAVSKAKRDVQYIDDKYQPLSDPQYEAKKAAAAKKGGTKGRSGAKTAPVGKESEEGVSV